MNHNHSSPDYLVLVKMPKSEKCSTSRQHAHSTRNDEHRANHPGVCSATQEECRKPEPNQHSMIQSNPAATKKSLSLERFSQFPEKPGELANRYSNVPFH